MNTIFSKVASDVGGWKHGHSTGVQAFNTGKEWQIGPNPATDKLVLYEPLSTVKKASYRISDILGKDMLSAGIAERTQELNIGNFVPGMYVIHIYEDGAEVKTEKFVKE